MSAFASVALYTVFSLLCLDSHQDWIMEQWEKNFYISSIAGAANGSSLVVMSKGWFLPMLILGTSPAIV